MALQELQGDKLQDSGSLQIVKVADSVFLTKQTARSSSLYASTLLDQPGSQAYNIDLESQGSHGRLISDLYRSDNFISDVTRRAICTQEICGSTREY